MVPVAKRIMQWRATCFVSVNDMLPRMGGAMEDRFSRQELQGFAVELRQLAYTMPAGHEDRLIHLSERMARRAIQLDAEARGA